MRKPRFWTNKVVEAMQDSAIEPYDVAIMCLNYMSEADVEDMCRCNDLFQEEENDEQG
jgi:hypothetical protein